jgi:ABC-type sugar transport system permease subunit
VVEVANALVFLPLATGLFAASLAWRKLANPLLFLVVGVLILAGIQAIAAPISPSSLAVSSAVAPTIDSQSGFVDAVFAGAAAQVLFGSPLLRWLFVVLPKR